jgi:peptidoglycan/LPS O-acetylase OafA/YrhL
VNTTSLNTSVTQPKQHFEILDGLRGVAAIVVVIFHFTEFVYPDYSKNFFGHGFLAVDFFFCLSGFVIGYAYDDRMAKTSIWEFFKLRLIRLHPLVVLGSVLGLLGFLFDPFSTYSHFYSPGKIFLVFLSSALLIPYPVMPHRAFGLFSFNSPAWSLFFEYVANVFYGIVLWKIVRRYLLILTLVAAFVLCVFSYHDGTLIGGWSRYNIEIGFARVFYSFLAGLVLYRLNWIIKTNVGFLWLSVLLLVTFIMPYFKWNWLAEDVVVLFYFPLLIAIAVGATLTPKFKQLCVFFGKISYPLYMTHIPGVWVFGNYYATHKVGATQLYFIITAGTLFLIGVAYVAMVIYDTPTRQYLTRLRKAH